jgi:hypothetical protein
MRRHLHYYVSILFHPFGVPVARVVHKTGVETPALIVTPILGYISMIVGAGFNPTGNRTEHLNSKCEIINAK